MSCPFIIVSQISPLILTAFDFIIPGRYAQMPWHVCGINGWHEDFHLVVACGDLAFCMMAYDAGMTSLMC